MGANNLKELVKKNKKYVKEDINLNELIDKFLRTEQYSSHRHHSSFFHPSLISKGVECQLWWYFYLKGTDVPPTEFSDETLTAMAVGTAIHNETQHILYRMGILEGVWKCLSCGHKFWAVAPKDVCPNCNQKIKSWSYVEFKEVPIQTSMIRGHADGLLNQDGVRFLLELKSIKNVDRPNAKYGFEKLESKPLDDHFMQAQLYMYGWNEIAKQAPLGKDIVVDEAGKLSTVELNDPVFDGARVIGTINNGLIEYVAKNSSQKKSFLIKRNTASIQFLLDEMQLIWKAYLEDTIEILKGPGVNCTTNCKKCIYKGTCTWWT